MPHRGGCAGQRPVTGEASAPAGDSTARVAGPVQVTGLTGATQVAAGSESRFATHSESSFASHTVLGFQGS